MNEEPPRTTRDQALLAKLDRALDSVLAANAAIPFKPKLYPRYAGARLIAWLTSLIGWAVILVGLSAIALALGIGRLENYADLVDWISVPTAVGAAFGGLVLINLAAMTRASLDAADYHRQLLQLDVARNIRGVTRRPPPRPGKQQPPPSEPIEPTIE